MSEDKETITIAQKQLDELLAQNAELLEQNRSLVTNATKDEGRAGTLKPEEINQRTVRIVFVDGNAVQAFDNKGTVQRPTYVYNRPDPKNTKEQIAYVDVFFFGEDKAVPVPYVDLLREGSREECKIVKTDVKEWDMVQGQTTQKVVKDFDTQDTGILVPIRVIGEKRMFTVALPDGKEMDIHETFVNM